MGAIAELAHILTDTEEGVVEGERNTSPEDEASLAIALTARQDDLRGQAEGQRNASIEDIDLSNPAVCDREDRFEGM